MYDIIVMGSINLDIVVQCVKFPNNGDSAFCKSIEMIPGGKGNNQAVNSAHFGKKVCFIGSIGNDSSGQQLRDNLVKRNIDDRFLIVNEKEETGSCVCLLDENGENTLLVNLGANFAFGEKEVRKVFDEVKGKILLLQMETGKESIITAMRLARERGMYVILDPAPVDGIDLDYLPYADLVVPNSHETQRISGIEVTDPDSALKAARIIHEMGVRHVIVKMGGDGCLLLKDGQSTYLPAMKVKAVDTVGAGDCFAGALANYLIDHPDDLISAIKFAQIAAGIKVSRRGGHDAIPSLEEVTAYKALVI